MAATSDISHTDVLSLSRDNNIETNFLCLSGDNNSETS